jgi:hypothetical protein
MGAFIYNRFFHVIQSEKEYVFALFMSERYAVASSMSKNISCGNIDEQIIYASCKNCNNFM